MLKILLSISEFGGLWKHPNTPARTKTSNSVKVFNLLRLDTIQKKKMMMMMKKKIMNTKKKMKQKKKKKMMIKKKMKKKKSMQTKKKMKQKKKMTMMKKKQTKKMQKSIHVRVWALLVLTMMQTSPIMPIKVVQTAVTITAKLPQPTLQLFQSR